MKTKIVILAILCSCCLAVSAQKDTSLNFQPRKLRLVAGIQTQEHPHAGVFYDVSKSFQMGCYIGSGSRYFYNNSDGWFQQKSFTTYHLELRYYFGRKAKMTGHKRWFCSSDLSYWAMDRSYEMYNLNHSIGFEINYAKCLGMTIDWGIYTGNVGNNRIYYGQDFEPFIRIQMFFAPRKSSSLK